MTRENGRKQGRNGSIAEARRGAGLSGSRGRDRVVEVVSRLCRRIEASQDQPMSLTELGRLAHLSPPYLQRIFKRVTGVTPKQYADACRLGHLKSILKVRDNVTTAMYEVGFGSSSRLYERAPAHLGMTPAAYRKGGSATTICYTITTCPLGRLLLAATERGICAVRLGDRETDLTKDLEQEFPAASIERDDETLGEWVDSLLGHLAGQRPHLELPLDIQATAFQQRVWQELQAIPYGSTRTYREIALALGRPKAVRAVGRACASNPAAIVIPCHRAVRADGGLGGYRWGLERKKKLLAREQEVAREDQA
jgi:AraC family transcriptional regulator, regulatory protein of adaptative response / methylated-DNA-[protein]-cysteine methyltransferase